MVRVVFGTGLPTQGELKLGAVVTLGEAIERLEDEIGWLAEAEVRYFVDGVDAARLEGAKTPVGDEDTVLVTEA